MATATLGAAGPVGSFRGLALRPWREAATPKARGIRVIALLAGIVLICTGDLYMTLMYATTVGFFESNPLARAVMEHGSAWLVVLWKFATMALGVGLLFYTRRTRLAEIAAWVCLAIMLGLCVKWGLYAKEMTVLTPQIAELAAFSDHRWVSMTQE